MSDDVIASDPRSGRGWGVVAALAVAVLVVAALRPGGDGDPGATPSPTATAVPTTPVIDLPETPPPGLSAPPGPPVHVTAVDDTVVARDAQVLYRTRVDHRIDAFVPLRDGFAAVVTEEPQQSANPLKLAVSYRGAIRTFTLDEETTVVAGATADTFWTTRRGGAAQRRDARGTVVATERVPLPYRVVAGTAAGLLVTSDEGRVVALWRRDRADVLARDVAYVASTATHVAWFEGTCLVACDVVVRDVRGRDTWTLRSPNPGIPVTSVRLNPRGDAVAMVSVSAAGSFVHAGRRGGRAAEVAETAEFDRLTSYEIDWVEDTRLAVFEVRDQARAFVYDLLGRDLESVGTYDVGNVLALYADPL